MGVAKGSSVLLELQRVFLLQLKPLPGFLALGGRKSCLKVLLNNLMLFSQERCEKINSISAKKTLSMSRLRFTFSMDQIPRPRSKKL